MAEFALDKVIHYGAFKENLDRIVDIMRSEYSGSVVIRGNPGAGKITLIREAVKITGVRCVEISSDRFIDDYASMKNIASKLGFSARGAHIADLMREIKGKIQNKEKFVIVLIDFEEFCRTRQSLLYNLMNLIHVDHTRLGKGDELGQCGPNLTLIGLTCNMDWAENIEKRVRSRLNAKCIDITFPYRNAKELVEFSSQLLERNKIDKDLKEHLLYLYGYLQNPSVRVIKRFFNSMIELDKKNKIVLKLHVEDWKYNHQANPNTLMRKRLLYLMRPQLNLLKLALHHCFIYGSTRFTLRELQTTANARNYRSFQADCTQTLTDAARLLKMKLFKLNKHDQPTGVDCVFTLGVTSTQFKTIISGTPELQWAQTDAFWKYLK